MRRLAFVAALALMVLPSGSALADIDHPIPGDGLRVATRLNPPKPSPMPVLWTTEAVNGRCVGLVAALEYWNPGWDVTRMSGIAYRESRCDPNASNSCCSGMFQIHRIWIDDAAMCGVRTRDDLYDPWKNVCTAAIIYRTQGMGAWSTA